MTMLSEKELCCCRASELQLHPTNPPQRKEGKLENPMIQKKTENSSYITLQDYREAILAESGQTPRSKSLGVYFVTLRAVLLVLFDLPREHDGGINIPAGIM